LLAHCRPLPDKVVVSCTVEVVNVEEEYWLPTLKNLVPSWNTIVSTAALVSNMHDWKVYAKLPADVDAH